MSRDNERQTWRDERLEMDSAETVTAPIRYCRLSSAKRGGNIYTLECYPVSSIISAHPLVGTPSEEPGLVGAETFAAVDPTNNRKQETDLRKLAAGNERDRYIFLMSPRYPGFNRHREFELNDIQV